MSDARPDPDELLERVVADEQRTRRGKLTLFFGAAPGVGKTYAMLQAARAEAEREKRDVVVGVVETHGRYETAALVLGLELLPRRRVVHRGVEVLELDLDGALRRRPDLILVDELAHTNAHGSRHAKRWQDVEELLDAGIDVFSTMNVQHVESLSDVVARITGVVVRETVPDSVLERAQDLRLVDLPPDDLLERLRDGKVYVPAQAQRAIENFFRKGNLIALRELALRQTAERVDAEMHAYRRRHGIERTWAAAEQLLVAVSASPHSAALVRAARRMATALHARWFAVFVDTPSARGLPAADRARLSQNLRLAERLGAEVVTLSGEDASEAVLRFSRERNITKIIVGKPTTLRWRDRFRLSLVDRIVRDGGDVDVFVTAGDREPEEPAAPAPAAEAPQHDLRSLGAGALVSALATAVGLLFGPDQLPDVVMIYLTGIVIVSARYPLRAALFAAVLSVAQLDFFFVPPFRTFAVADLHHAVTFAVMFAVAVVISGLTQRVKNQALAARRRESLTRALYACSRDLAGVIDRVHVISIASRHIEDALGSRVSVYAPLPGRPLARVGGSEPKEPNTEQELAIADWVWTNRKEAGLGTSTLSRSRGLYVPLLASGGIVGVLGVEPRSGERLDDHEQRSQIEAFAAQLALALERAALSEESERARRAVETEQLRSSLLSSVSHDLRTPLAVITGAASTMVERGDALDVATRTELTHTVLDEAERLNHLIRNVLDMTRLDSGAVRVKKEWLSIEEVIGAALARVEPQLRGRDVRVALGAPQTLVPMDPILVEQVLINLLENALKYGADPIEIDAHFAPDVVTVAVADRGPGVPPGEEDRVFDKFHRAAREPGRGGVGLGLAICRAIVAAHGGEIEVQRRAGGGCSFRFTLPIAGEPPGASAPEAL